jgi:hypothetical protein
MPTEDEMKERAARALSAADVPQPGQVFRHYKGGLYSIVTPAIKEDTHEIMVIYRSNAKGTTWARTLANFTETIEIIDRDGARVQRFTRETD